MNYATANSPKRRSVGDCHAATISDILPSVRHKNERCDQKMQKDFDRWNTRKKKINASNTTKFPKRREIWWCSIGVNVGIETDGKSKFSTRPVLILKKYNRNQLLVVPLSTQIKPSNTPYRYNFTHNNKQQCALLSQIRVIDTKRIGNRIGRIPSNLFDEIVEAIKDTF